jgi:Mn-dependent DtxR family transcriptional regulator
VTSSVVPRRPVRGVTEEQQRAIQVIACLTLLHGRPPTLTEIAEVLEVTKEAVFYRLHWLEKKGLWRKEDRRVTELGLRTTLGLHPV